MNSKFKPMHDGILTNRKLEFFHAPSLEEWGYTKEQTDTFAVLHPEDENEGAKYPLYVVFHSAGHDVYSAIACTWQKNNHDIYRAPKGMYALYLDCRQHSDTDWWWGGNVATRHYNILLEKRAGIKKQPVENRCIATVEWVMENYPIDRNRVYAVGNSMGGSGALGVAMCRGDIFAAVKVNVPAGVNHVLNRCCLDIEAPDGFKIPDPPILVDYSAQNDVWSEGHEILYREMRKKKYAILGYWGNFGHANSHEDINKLNDLIHSFDIFSVRLNEAYPVFTDADTDDVLPWNSDGSIAHDKSGQVNSFFRWGKVDETETTLSVDIRLITADEWESRVAFPKTATTNVSFRRIQKCHFAPKTSVYWEYGNKNGFVVADENGLVTVPNITVTTIPMTLKLMIK